MPYLTLSKCSRRMKFNVFISYHKAFFFLFTQRKQNMKVIRVTDSTVKGYHVFKVTPHPAIPMFVKKDEGNSYDPNAMVVKVPDLKEIPAELHDVVTKEAKGKKEKQTVRDTAGMIVGRVPANLCGLFRKLLQDGDIREVTCVSVDKPMQSKIPSSHQSFKRNTNGHDRCGGGALIPCTYRLKCFDESSQRVVQFMTEKILSFKGSEKVVLLEEKPFSCPF